MSAVTIDGALRILILRQAGVFGIAHFRTPMRAAERQVILICAHDALESDDDECHDIRADIA